jgi:hypothetical protein
MGIREDFKHYMDRFNLVQPEGGSTSGNGLIYTALYVAALEQNIELGFDDADKLRIVYESCEQEPGLMRRAPCKNDQEGPDDYIGVAYAAHTMHYPELAQRIVAYGDAGIDHFDPYVEERDRLVTSRLVYLVLSLFGLLRVENVWNNSDPGKFTLSAWLGRNVGLMTHLKLAAGEGTSVVERLFWCIGMLSCLFKENDVSDPWIQCWMMRQVARNNGGWMCDMVSKLWTWRFKKVWPKGLGEAVSKHFQNPGHPAAIWLMGVF